MERRHLAGKGFYTSKCTEFLQDSFNFKEVLLTPSCSDALEMAALLCDLGPEDEVVIPAYTFVSTANAFALRGAKIRYADSSELDPNAGLKEIQQACTNRTKAIVAVHYGGYNNEIDAISSFCAENNIILIEDAACALGSQYDGRYLGTFGDLATFSFHETKNITCGKGGALVINNSEFSKRARIIWEKGTNRTAFFKGEVDKYGWVDLGSSYLNSELMAAFLWPQLKSFEKVNLKRKSLWEQYDSNIIGEGFKKIKIAASMSYNFHEYFILTDEFEHRSHIIQEMKEQSIQTVFHYQALNKSNFSISLYGEQDCPNAEKIENTLLRLPLHYWLEERDILTVAETLSNIKLTKYE